MNTSCVGRVRFDILELAAAVLLAVIVTVAVHPYVTLPNDEPSLVEADLLGGSCRSALDSGDTHKALRNG